MVAESINNDDPMACSQLKGGYARWDGRKWTPVAPPDGTQPAQIHEGVAVTDDGAGWAMLEVARTNDTVAPLAALGRYADGQWRLVGPAGFLEATAADGVKAVSEGRPCIRLNGRDSVQFDSSTTGLPVSSVRCFDATGEVSHISTLNVGIVTDVSIATDGGTWVKMAPNDEIARLNVTSHAAAVNPATSTD